MALVRKHYLVNASLSIPLSLPVVLGVLGQDSPSLNLYYLSLWLALFQSKILLVEKTVIVELGESWPWCFDPTVRLRCWAKTSFCMKFENRLESIKRLWGRERYLAVREREMRGEKVLYDGLLSINFFCGTFHNIFKLAHHTYSCIGKHQKLS